MAEPILPKSPPKESKKTSPKVKKSTPATASAKMQKAEEPSIPLYRSELFQLHDVADALRLLRDVAEVGPEFQLIQTETLIKQTSRCAWNLVHEELDGRWQDTHPDVDLVRND
jgi:hypothetical protein